MFKDGLNQPPAAKPVEISHKKPKMLIYLIIILVILILTGLAYLAYANYGERLGQKAATNTATNKTADAVANDENAADDTASWPTYTNGDFGFSFRYPADYIAKKYEPCANSPEGMDRCVSPAPLPGGIEEIVFVSKNNESINIYASTSISDGLKLNYIEDAPAATDLTIGGKAAKKYGDKYYVVNSSQFHFEFVDSKGTLGDILSSLVTTITFSGNAAVADETADWKTYTDSNTGLSFKYPTTWGEPKSELTNYSNDLTKDKSLFNGKIISLSFKDYSISIAGVTSDYMAFMQSLYTGNNPNLDLAETNYTSGANSSFLRKKFTIAGVKSYYDLSMDYLPEASGIVVRGKSFLNGRKDFKGINIYYGFPTLNDRLNTYYSATDDNSKLESQAASEITKLANGTSTDQAALNQYREFQNWLSTFQFTD